MSWARAPPSHRPCLLGAASGTGHAASGARSATGGPFVPVLPPPTGRHRTGRTQVHLRDDSRADPWKPGRARELMVTLTYPTVATGLGRPRPRWLSRAHADELARGGVGVLGLPRGAVDWRGIRVNAVGDAPVLRPRGGLPVVILMAGALMHRAETVLHAEELASHGYLVAQPDFTYETPAVEFPGGRVLKAVIKEFHEYEDADLKRMIQARVDDTESLLDALGRLHRGHRADASGRRVPEGFAGALDLDRVGAGGHSAGGFATGEAMHAHRRIRAGANLDGMLYHSANPQNADGWVFGDSGREGLADDQAFLLLGSEWAAPPPVDRPSPNSHVNDEFLGSWKSFWAAHRGWKRDFTLKGSRHNTFVTAAPVHHQLVDGVGLAPERLTPFLGTTPPDRATRAQRALLTAFFDHHLRDRPDPGGLLDGDTAGYPDLIHVP
ncbi:hypothetical protein ACFWPV_11335 [Streptomyces uncialis]|uniref:hypothetical protein n=1 Tax=Streptomyces uncialis TaxID=1048205 RepID=UPI00364AC2F7